MKLRSVRFKFDELVELHDPQQSVKLNGMVDVIQTTEGYAEVNSSNEIENLLIDSCIVDTGTKKLTNTDVLKDKSYIVKILNAVLCK